MNQGHKITGNITYNGVFIEVRYHESYHPTIKYPALTVDGGHYRQNYLHKRTRFYNTRAAFVDKTLHRGRWLFRMCI